MPGPFEVTREDIERLSDTQLTKLLQNLLIQEAQLLGLPKLHVHVGLKINIPDGGEDGCFEWAGGPEPTGSNWITNRLNVFQVKATYMGPTACGDEVLVKDKSALKPRVVRVIEGGGNYILFYGDSCESKLAAERIEHIRKAFEIHYDKKITDLVNIYVFGSEKIAEWVNEYATAITYVLTCNGKPIPTSFQSWEDWNEEHPSQLKFYEDSKRTSAIATIKSHIQTPGSIVRLAALSGLGKTRLALESFRPPKDSCADPEQSALSASCIYVQDGEKCSTELISMVRSFSKSNIHACIVVDECPLSLHRDLGNIIAKPNSKLSLLTLDFDPDSDPRKSNQVFIGLDPIPDNEMIDLLKNSDVKLPSEFIEKIAAFVQGYPRMAEFLVDALQLGEPRLWDLAPPDLYEKLIKRRSKDPELTISIAQALSIFEHIGIEGDVEDQLDAFASNICMQDKAAVYAIIRDLEIVRIAYRRGDYIRITPLPLAVALAEKWWNHCSESTARSLLSGELVPPDLVDATANQLRRLRGHPRVERLVSSILGPTSPFRKRDRLDTAPGSRLVSSLAEVNPRAVCDALIVAFAGMSTEEVSKLGPGRRQLVWCLEKLCWWRETFFDAASILLRFAAGETEKIGNNSTRQFLQLFHIYLSGTETPAIERLRVIEFHLSSSDAAIQKMAILGACEAFMAHSFQRTGGVESQGGGIPRSDWQPHSQDELIQYWKTALNILSPYLIINNELGSLIKKQLADNTRGLISSGGLEIVSEAINIYQSSGNHEWLQMLNALRETVNYDADGYTDKIKQVLTDLINRLQPTTVDSKILHLVSLPSWSEIKEPEPGKLIVIAEERAREFALELSTDISVLIPHLSKLLTSEQRQGFIFGSVLGENVPNRMNLLEAIIDQFKKIPINKRNPVFAMGFVSAFPNEDRPNLQSYLKNLLFTSDTKEIALDLIRSIRPMDSDIEGIIHLLNLKELSPWQVAPFAWGRALEQVSDKVVSDLVMACAAQGNEGALVAVDLLGMHVHGKELNSELSAAASHLVLLDGLLSSTPAAAGNYDHQYEMVAQKLLALRPDDNDLFINLCNRLLEYAGDGLNRSPAVNNLLNEIFKAKIDVVWPALKNFLHSADDHQLSNFKWVFRHSPNSGLDLISIIGTDRIISLCETDPNVAKWATTLATPLREPLRGAKYPSWNDLIPAILDRYGSNPEVRSAIVSNLFTGAWSGSRIPRLVQERTAFLELASHSNPEVITWATQIVESLDLELAQEKKREQEREFGIWR